MKRFSLFFLCLILVICVFALTSCLDLGGLLPDSNGTGGGGDDHEHDMSIFSTVSESGCLVDGIERVTCSICGYYEEHTVEGMPHGEMVLDGYEPTCYETGLTEGVVCPYCDAVLVEQEIIPIRHNEETVYGYPATCTEEGLSEGKRCSDCGAVTVEQTVLPPRHNLKTVKGYEPTCTEEGLSDGKECIDCGEVVVSQEILPPAHKNVEVVPGYAPTCTEEGLTDGEVCTDCGEVAVEQTVIPPQHTEEIIPGIPFSCTEDGLSEGKKCTLCGEITVEQTAVPASHVEKDVAGRESTCLEPGLTDGKKCAVCGEELVAQQVITQLKSHSYSGGRCTQCNSREASSGIEYKLSSDGTYYYVNSKGSCTDKDIYIANQYKGLPVKYIGSRAFYGANITSITLENGITGISTYGFSYCEQLESVFLPATLVEIGYSTFLGSRPVIYTNALSKKQVSSSFNTENCPVVWDYGNHGTTADGFVWASTKSEPQNAIIVGYKGTDTQLTIPSAIENMTVTKIGAFSFASREDIVAINLPEGIVEIETSAFAVTGITEMVLPSTLKRLGTTAFKNANNLTACNLPDGLEFIGAEAFVNTKITEIVIPDSVTEMGYGVFWECRALTSAVVGRGITVLYEKLFQGCYELSYVTLRGELTVIGELVFADCSKLVMDIPSTVEKIEDEAFLRCSSLKKLVIPNSVTELGNSVFKGCWGATEIVIGSGIYRLPQSTFQSCGSLTEVIIPRNIKRLGSNVFSGCAALEFVFIPIEVTSIDANAFDESPKLAIVAEAATRPTNWVNKIAQSSWDKDQRWNEANATVVWDCKEYGMTDDGIYWAVKNATPDSATVVKYSGMAVDVVIPEQIDGVAVTSIEWKAFINRSDLTSVTIPDSVVTISFDPFDGCTNLTIYCEVAEQPANWYWVSDKYTFVWNHKF